MTQDASVPRGAAGITFDAVSVAYQAKTALRSFTLAVRPGEVMALLGPSGSGKTTALRCVAGFVTPTAGRVLLADRDITRVPPHQRGIGVVVQQYALFPHLRVAANVGFGLRAQGVSRGATADRVAEMLALTGMADYARRYPRELSGGQQQRVAIARALAIRPRVLLLDEPLSALDARLRATMLTELARLHRELPDVTILYVTHDQVEALTLADRICLMNDGAMVECATPHELYHNPRTEFAASFLGGANLLPVRVESTSSADASAPGSDAAATADPGSVIAVSFDGTRIRATSRARLLPGASALMCVRPHRLRLDGVTAGVDGSRGNEISGVVTEVSWRGSTHRVQVEAGGHQLNVDIAESRDPVRLGAPVRLRFDPDDAIVLDEAAASEARQSSTMAGATSAGANSAGATSGTTRG